MLVDVYRSPYQYDPDTYHYSSNPSNSFKHHETSCDLIDDEEDFPKPITIAGKKIEFILNDECKPAIKCEDCEMSSLAELVQLLNPLHLIKKQSELKNWAILTTYLTSGLDYQYIDNVDEFKKSYQVKLQKNTYNFSHAYTPPKTSIDEIQSPRLEGNRLTFYVKKGSVPYRVVTQFKKDNKAPKVFYQVLGSK